MVARSMKKSKPLSKKKSKKPVVGKKIVSAKKSSSSRKASSLKNKMKPTTSSFNKKSKTPSKKLSASSKKKMTKAVSKLPIKATKAKNNSVKVDKKNQKLDTKKKPLKKTVAKKTAVPSKSTSKQNKVKHPSRELSKKKISKEAISKETMPKETVSKEKKINHKEISNLTTYIAKPKQIQSKTITDNKSEENYMTPEQQTHFRKILLEWKDQLIKEVEKTVHHMQDEASNFPDPNDRATQEEEFRLELRTRDRERKLIQKINEALHKIDNNEYGYCDACGVEIGIPRLEARPTANLCIDCKTVDEMREKQYN